MDGDRGSRKSSRKLLALGAIAAVALTWSHALDRAAAADRKSDSVFISEATDVRKVTVTVNKSRTFKLERPFATIVAGSPDIADVKPLGDRTLYVLGRQTGTTNIVLFDDASNQIGILDVEVTIDTGNVQQKIQDSTGTRGIRVSSSQGQVVLTGTAVDATSAARAMEVATGLVPKDGRIVNAMNVAAPQQVMLEVRFLEVARTAGRDLGVNLFAANANGTNIANSGLGSVTAAGRSPIGGINTAVVPGQANLSQGGTAVGTPPTGSLPVLGTVQTLLGVAGSAAPAPFGSLLTSIIRTSNGGSVDLLITALETKGLVRSLAEPNLIALSGDSARFLAGGEIPVPTVQPGSGNGVPTITTQYKPFGVELAFVPTVLSRGIINLRIEPSVSELDFANAVNIAGTAIPALTSRSARTTVELRDGQSFAVAGLLQTRNVQSVSQLPWIGSVPVLGTLFSSKSYQQLETDLVIIVTPRLVAPAVPGQNLASPLDSRQPANDVDFFLNGQMEVKKRYTDYVNSGGDIKGPYGHIIAPDVRLSEPAVVVTDQPVLRTKN